MRVNVFGISLRIQCLYIIRFVGKVVLLYFMRIVEKYIFLLVRPCIQARNVRAFMTNYNFERKIQIQTTQHNNNNKTLFILIINTDDLRRWYYFIIIRKKIKIETRLTTMMHLETGCSIVGQDLYDVMLHHYIHNSPLYQRLLCTYLRA